MSKIRKNAREISRQVIIEATWRLVSRSGIKGLTVAAVAAEAGLTRQAVYWHMKNRAGLLAEAGRYNDTRLPQSALIRDGLPDADAVTNSDAVTRAWAEALPNVAPYYLALMDAALGDADARRSLAERVEVIRGVIERHAARLEEEGALREGLEPRQAAELIAAHASPSVWYYLTQVYGWSARRFADHLVEITRQMIHRAGTEKEQR